MFTLLVIYNVSSYPIKEYFLAGQQKDDTVSCKVPIELALIARYTVLGQETSSIYLIHQMLTRQNPRNFRQNNDTQ